MENLQFPTHLLTGKYKTFHCIKLGFLYSQGGIWFLSIRARRGPSRWVFRCLLSGTDARPSVFPGCAWRKAGCCRREAPLTEIAQICPALWQVQGTRYLKSGPLCGAAGEAPLCMASTGGSRDISNKKAKESLFHPRHQRALSWWVTVKALRKTPSWQFSLLLVKNQCLAIGVRWVGGGLLQHLWALGGGMLVSLSG